VKTFSLDFTSLKLVKFLGGIYANGTPPPGTSPPVILKQYLPYTGELQV